MFHEVHIPFTVEHYPLRVTGDRVGRKSGTKPDETALSRNYVECVSIRRCTDYSLGIETKVLRPHYAVDIPMTPHP